MYRRERLAAVDAVDLYPAYGFVERVAAGHAVANGPLAAIGGLCRIDSADRRACVAQVTAVSTTAVTLVPLDHASAIRPGDRVTLISERDGVRVGDGFAGRVIDALGEPLDGLGPIAGATGLRDMTSQAPVLDRTSPTLPAVTGVRAIDGLLTIGRGQRIGVFAASGVGKTRLVEQLARQIECDWTIICQVGERGREVEALWSELRRTGRGARTTIVAATSDESAAMRVRSVQQALALAEHRRAQGGHVLFVIDSVTRLAMALREIGLASGEPPPVRAYTPNVLSELPRLVERCGAVRGGGAITAIFTVLSETDDVDDPIVEIMKSLLDGHILLSRMLARAGHYPAIDIGGSISRLSDRLVSPDHGQAAGRALELLARYEEARVLIESGLYKAGSDPGIDRAIATRPALTAYLKQRSDEAIGWDAMLTQLTKAIAHG